FMLGALAALALSAATVAAIIFVRPVPPSTVAPPPETGELAYRPRGADEPVSSPIAISFGRAVPQGEVEQGFSLTPPASGRLSWQGNTLLFRADYPGLAEGTAYKVSVRLPDAVAAQIGAPGNPLTYEFTTTGKLAVQAAFPETGSMDVATNTPLLLSFNRPVAPLTTLAKTTESPLRLEPAVDGEGRWITSTLYRFAPKGGWKPSASYTVTVPQTVSDTLGAQLPADFTWTFGTVRPAVADTSPRDNAQFAGPRQEIKVTLNQPVDRTGAQAAFTLEPTVAGGVFSWPDDRTMIFTPSVPLRPAAAYTARVVAGAVFSKAASWTFRTVGAPAVTRTIPAPGAVTDTRPVQFTFAHPMDQESVEKAIAITPASQDKPQTFWNQDRTEFTVYVPGMKPSSAYTVTLAAGAKDAFGQTLDKATAVPFTTQALRPQASVMKNGAVGTLDADGALSAPLRLVNLPTADLKLYRLTRQQVAAQVFSNGPRPDLPAGGLVRSWTFTAPRVPENTTQVVAAPLRDAQGQRLAPGYYALSVQPPASAPQSSGRGASETERALFVVTRTHLTLKQADGQALVWAVDVATGRPVADLPVTLYDKSGAQQVATGRTDADGLFQAPAPRTPGPSNKPGTGSPEDIYVLAEALRGPNAEPVLASPVWSGTTGAWQFNIHLQYQRQDFVTFGYTDRPIYR
ncbi:MAG: Ig-like domain-containing protein, partial [Chloroflexi bacterium]|nr:Ig-like domain-containing protein [Chloroflexota bacterium]